MLLSMRWPITVLTSLLRKGVSPAATINLPLLQSIDDVSCALIYVDPPFNSNRRRGCPPNLYWDITTNTMVGWRGTWISFGHD